MSVDVTVEDWQMRIIEERSELETRLYLLNMFLKTKEYDRLDQGEKYRLGVQIDAMRQYALALTERITHFYTVGA